MKLTKVFTARSLWFLDFGELNLAGVSIVPIVNAIAQQYSFQKRPARVEELNLNEGIGLTHGIYMANRSPLAVDLVISGSLLAATTQSSTGLSDQFLGELLAWLSNQFGLQYRQEMVREKSYVSEIEVQAQQGFDVLTDKLQRFVVRLREAGIAGGKTPFVLSHLAFGPDPASQIQPAAFSLQRRAGKSLQERRYFSTAPLPTSTHLELLAEMESILAP